MKASRRRGGVLAPARRLLTAWRTRRKQVDELHAEFDAHIAHRADDLIRQGLAPDEARRSAVVEFGGVERYRGAIQRERVVSRLGGTLREIGHELALGARRLRQSPGFTAFAVLTLGVGIGIATAAYSGLYAFALRPRGFQTESIALLVRTNSVGQYPAPISWADYRDLEAQWQSVEELAGWRTMRQVTLSSPGGTELVDIEAVTGGFFSTLGARPALGRLLQAADAAPGAPPVVVLSDAAWRFQFNGAADIIGTTAAVAGEPVEVVGVAPPGFRGVTAPVAGQTAAWVPISLVPRIDPRLASWFDEVARSRPLLSVAARLPAETEPRQAAAEVETIARRLDDAAPLSPFSTAVERTRAWSVVSYDESSAVITTSEAGRLILALPLLVFLVACTNLTNLFLSRWSTRRQELAVRTALGASRARLIRSEMAEAAVVAAGGALVGALFAHGVLVWSLAMLDEPLSALAPTIALRWRVEPMFFIAALGCGLLAVLMAGLAPAVRLTKPNAGHALNVDAMTAAPRWRGRSNLIALQVAVSVALFLIAAVAVRFIVSPPSRSAQRGPVPGLERLVVATLPFGTQRIDEARGRTTLEAIVQRVRAIPAVDGVAIASGLAESRPWAGGSTALVTTPDAPFSSEVRGHSMTAIASTPDAFGVMGVAITSGRGFNDRDVLGAPRVVVLSARVAEQVFEGEPVVGRPILLQLETDVRDVTWTTVEATVVGVATRRGLTADEDRSRAVWMPYAQQFLPTMGIVARSSNADARPLVAAVKDVIRQTDQDLAIQSVARADALVNGPLAFLGFIATTAGSLGMIALVLAMGGLYGVLSHVFAMRRREMGLRLALGADRSRIFGLVARSGFRPVFEGLAIGLLTAWIVRQLMQLQFTGTLSAIDAAMFGSAAVPLLLAAAVACYLPARRAARVDPNVALKDL